MGTLDVALQIGRSLLINVEWKAIVRSLAVIAVHARSHSVCHNVFADSFQLVLRAILQIQEGFQADFLALSLLTIMKITRKEKKKKDSVTNSIIMDNNLMVSLAETGGKSGNLGWILPRGQYKIIVSCGFWCSDAIVHYIPGKHIVVSSVSFPFDEPSLPDSKGKPWWHP